MLATSELVTPDGLFHVLFVPIFNIFMYDCMMFIGQLLTNFQMYKMVISAPTEQRSKSLAHSIILVGYSNRM